MTFYYRNYKGICGLRRVQEPRWWYGKTQYHDKMQWLLQAFDIDKQDFRDFAARDIIHFE